MVGDTFADGFKEGYKKAFIDARGLILELPQEAKYPFVFVNFLKDAYEKITEEW